MADTKPTGSGAEDAKDAGAAGTAPASMAGTAPAGDEKKSDVFEQVIDIDAQALAIQVGGAVQAAAAGEVAKHQDDIDDATEEIQATKKSLFGSLRKMIPIGDSGETSSSCDDRKRTWDFTFALRAMQNVTTVESLKVFFCVSCIHDKAVDGQRKPMKGVLPKYTKVYHLPKAEKVSLDVPFLIQDQKRLQLSYKDLQRYCVQIDMWQVSALTFNVYYGWAKKTFKDLVTREAATNLILQRKKTRAEMADKKQSKSRYDVATFDCLIMFEEFKKFVLIGNHWTMDMTKYDCQCDMKMQDGKKMTEKQKKHQRNSTSKGSRSGKDYSSRSRQTELF